MVYALSSGGSSQRDCGFKSRLRHQNDGLCWLGYNTFENFVKWAGGGMVYALR